MREGTAKNALDAAFGGGEELAPRGPLRALADGGRVAAAHVARDPEAAVADAELDVVAPVGGDVEAGGHQAYEKADDQKNEPRLHGVVELIPESGVIFFESGRRC